ncbi:MAG: type III-B CRISPR module RAMP protein Cmr4 [Thermoanaerobaculia bacterium]
MGKKTLEQFAVLGLYTETPLHCGAESTTGFVDLPVQRERHTNYPVIPGSTIKGVLRDDFVPPPGTTPEGLKELRDRFFGKEDSTNAGSVAFGDGILVAFPVRSSGAPFHWVTCPFALERAFRTMGETWSISSEPGEGQAWAHAALGDIALEDVTVTTVLHESHKTITDGLLKLIPATAGFGYLRKIFEKRLLVLHDNDFQEIVETSTEVLTRIKLNSQGTTAELSKTDKGNMFVEELVPSDTLFLAPLRGDESIIKPYRSIPDLIRLGGDETVGRGVTHAVPVTSSKSAPVETGKGV